MSHRGEGAIYKDGQDRPSLPVATSRQRTSTAGVAEMAQSGTSTASPQPLPPPLPTSNVSPDVPRMAEEKSQVTMKLDQAVDARQLAAHDVVSTLRIQLEQIFEQWTQLICLRPSIVE